MLSPKRVAMVAAGVMSAAVVASPAGAATTAWTASHLTTAVKSVQRYVASDKRRDASQGRQITALKRRVTYLGTTSVDHDGRLSQLSVLVADAGTRLTAIEAAQAIQNQLNGGIIQSVTAIDPQPGIPNGGWTITLQNGQKFDVYNGAKGEKGDKGATGAPGQDGAPGQNGTNGQDGTNGRDGAPGQSAYETWLSLGNTGTVGDFMKSLTGPQGPKGETGAPGQDGTNGRDGAPGQSAYQEWLSLGNSGTMGDFMQSLKGSKGDKGDTGPQGAPGIPNAQKVLICVAKKGNSYHLAFAGDCAGEDTLQVYIPTS